MPTKEEEAVALAQTHYKVETGLTHVFRIIGDGAAEAMPEEPIKLLEVNENTVPSGILPIQFGLLGTSRAAMVISQIRYPSSFENRCAA
jgi:hypothetical protein